MGVDFSDQDLTLEDMKIVTRALWRTGITSYYPTVISNSDENLKHSFRLLSEFIKDKSINNSIPGFHLEGPYISPKPGFRGAHLEKYIHEPDWNEFLHYQGITGGKIKLITVAPELEGAIPFIRKCVRYGMIVSLGHHNGTSEIIQYAVDAGAFLSTHLGNGCANMINRHYNPLWPQLSNDELSISIISDGAHLTIDELRTFHKVKGSNQTILVSDALDLAGMPPGEYIRGERKVILTPEVIKYPAEDVLAGAASPLKKCVVNMMHFTNCSLEDAVKMASTNPAGLMGLQTGKLQSGKRADLILFKIENDEIVIVETYVAGELIFK